MKTITISRNEYRDKVFACWLGKNIGGTLGAPYECRKEVNNITFYTPVPQEPLPNDDLDLQLVWLKMLEDRGAGAGLPDFAAYWKKYLCAYPWNEYGFCMRNLSRGLMPPVSGWFENYYVDEMGSPIRSEIWACVAPADPQHAAALAWMDSAMDHAGGEGMWGEMFWAAVESAAFVVNDPYTLIRTGLAMIPPSCNISRVIGEAVWCVKAGKTCEEARDRIVSIYGNQQPCNAVQNHGFIIIGWLYGRDFGDRLCRAVNCGYDTDCTGATLGSVLGIIGGTSGIPEKWSKPVGMSIKLHNFTGHFNVPGTVEELTQRTVVVAEKFMAKRSHIVMLGEKTKLPPDLESLLASNEEAVSAVKQDVRAAVAADRDVEITLHYNGDPVLYPCVSRMMGVTARKAGKDLTGMQVKVQVPKGWIVKENKDIRKGFEVAAPAFTGTETITVCLRTGGKSYKTGFTVLSPDEAAGFPSAVNIEYCKVCSGRKGSCVCTR